MSKEYYLNDNAWAYCTNGTWPNTMRVVNKYRKVKNKGLILLNEEDRYNPFSCKFTILIMAVLAAFIAALSFLAAVLIGFLLGIGVCAIMTYKSKWINVHNRVIVEVKPAITTKSEILCYIGGTIKPTMSAAHAINHAGLTLEQTILEAFLINKGLTYLTPMFLQYGTKAGLGLFVTNFVLNTTLDKVATKPLTSITNDYLKKMWGLEPDPDRPNYVENAKDGINYSLDENGGNTRSYKDFKDTKSNTEGERSGETERIRQEEIARSNEKANKQYNQDIQRENTKINQEQKQAQRDYKKLYKEQARQEGLSGRSVDKEASRQAKESASQDAKRRKEQVRIEAEKTKQNTIEQGKNKANAAAENYSKSNPARTTLFFKAMLSAMGSVVTGVLTDVAFAQGHNWVDYYSGSKHQIAKKAGINVTAVNQ